MGRILHHQHTRDVLLLSRARGFVVGGSAPDCVGGGDSELLCEIRDLHVGAGLQDLTTICLQSACDDLQLRCLTCAIDACRRVHFSGIHTPSGLHMLHL